MTLFIVYLLIAGVCYPISLFLLIKDKKSNRKEQKDNESKI